MSQTEFDLGMLKEGVVFGIEESFSFADEGRDPAAVVAVNVPWQPDKLIEICGGVYLSDFIGHCYGRTPNCSKFFLKEARIQSKSSRLCSQV